MLNTRALKRLARRIGLTLAGTVAVGTALATTASAAVLVINDHDNDVIEIDSGYISYGDYDMDLRSVTVHHTTSSVVLKHQFDSLSATSFDALVVAFDTNGDRWADRTAVFDALLGESAVFLGDLDEDGPAVCRNVSTAMQMGRPGTLTLSVPRSCLGNPSSVAVNVSLIWSNYDGSLMYGERAPGDFGDGQLTFSLPVAVDRATVVKPNPAPAAKPAAASRIVVAGRPAGRKPLRVKVTSTALPQGKLTITVQGKRLQAQVKGRGFVSVKLPKSLKRGTHRATVRFVPTNPRVLKASSTTVKVKIR